MPKPIQAVINMGSGAGSADEECEAIKEQFAAAGLSAEFYFAEDGEDIVRMAEQSVKSGSEIIVAGGGDGTVSAVATEVYKAGKTLAVVPLGTLNNFSKDLGVEQDVEKALTTIAAGNTEEVDLAEVNGRIFINNSSIGLYPQIVRKREQQQERLGRGKWWAAAWATLRMFWVSRFLKVRIEIDGKTFLRKTPFVFVGNNPYEMDLYNIGRREALDTGKLSIYFLHRGGRWGVIMLLVHTLTGRVKQWRDFEEVLAESVTIQSRRRRLQVAFDGEVDVMETPLEYRILPKALKVIVPVNEETDA